MSTRSLTRRTILAWGVAGGMAGGMALAGCRDRAAATASTDAPADPLKPVPPLKMALPFPVGTAVMSGLLDDPALAALVTGNCNQVTPEFEMKMEAILQSSGVLDFTRADRIADFARTNGLRLHGHTLVWYAQDGPSFQALRDDRTAFGAAFDRYIGEVVSRYAGRASGWDVVNEPVAEDGAGYRDCLWRQVLGMAYVERAFHAARAADPDAVLFLNDYNLESRPEKRATFLKLAEGLLKAGAPLGGLGTQSHLNFDLAPGAVKVAIRDMASLGLPIHVSELDISLRPGSRRLELTSRAERIERQARLAGEVGEAFSGLPARQRYALTLWGLRDRDSWLRRPPNDGDGTDAPLMFDDFGAAKPAVRDLIMSVTR